MTTELVRQEMMTTEEAHAVAEEIRRLTESFKRNLARLRVLALEFDERKGWSALGYNTVEECARERFGWSRFQFFRQITAGKFEKDAGIPVGTTPEWQIRKRRASATKPQEDVANGNVSLSESCDNGNKPDNAPETMGEESDPSPTTAKVQQIKRQEQGDTAGGTPNPFGEHETEEPNDSELRALWRLVENRSQDQTRAGMVCRSLLNEARSVSHR